MANNKQIFHPWHLWEDHKHGFYSVNKQSDKAVLSEKIIELFESRGLTEKYMRLVCDKWVKSCEHNLTNQSMNKIAWLGQAASCLYCGASCFLTMNNWNKLSFSDRVESDRIAIRIIKEWEQKKKLESMLTSGKNEGTTKEYQMKLLLN